MSAPAGPKGSAEEETVDRPEGSPAGPETVDLTCPSGIIGLWDPTRFQPPDSEKSSDFLSKLRQLTQGGDLFFVESEDSSSLRIQVKIDQESPEEVADQFRPMGGSFRLRISSGKLLLAPIPPEEAPTEFSAAPGDYVVTPFAKEFDPEAYNATLSQEAGEKDWRFHCRIEKYGAMGCFWFLACAILLVTPLSRSLWWVWLPLFSLPTLAYYFLLRKLPRYKRVEALIAAYSKKYPDLLLLLRRSEVADAELRGGWISWS